MVRRGAISSVCLLLLLLAACPKRQASRSMVVYVPAQAPAATPAAQNPQMLVIEEPAPPAPPEPAQTRPAEQPAVQHRQGNGARPKPSTDTDEPPASEAPAPAPPPAAVPALEPRESSAQ